MRSFLFLFLLLCCGFAGLASATEADDSDYRNALKLLSEGSVEEARRAIEAVIARQPEHAGALLDLAILQCGMGLVDEAEALFARIEERFDPPLAIRDLIQRIRAQGCQRQEQSGGARLRFRLGRGHDSNANQGARDPYFSLLVDDGLIPLMLAPEFRPRSDSFTQLGLEASYTRPASETLLHGNLHARKYDRVSGYDLATGVVGAERPWRLGEWESRWGGSLGATWLGGRLYQKQVNAYAQVLPPWPDLPAGWRFSVVGDWSRVWYPTLYRFDADLLRAQALLAFQGQDTLFLGSLGVTRDDGEARRPGGDRRGWTSNLILRQRLGERLFGEFSWSHQSWRGERAYLPGLFNERRKQRATLWRAAATYAVVPRQSLTLEYRFLDNKENISLFGYRSRQIMLNWQYDFSN
ncbi:MAG: tetratricopeptide repeat protein [Betaproteobacteria bacterium]|nr:tetratricopeptide repeat protein [Betaproteobacteria bacterium]